MKEPVHVAYDAFRLKMDELVGTQDGNYPSWYEISDCMQEAWRAAIQAVMS